MKTHRIVRLGLGESRYIQILVSADLKMRNDAAVHAVSHGSDYKDLTREVALEILQKIEDAELIDRNENDTG